MNGTADLARPTDLVKSAARTLEILEVFAEERAPLTAAQIGRVLSYPKSSLSVLLRSLVAQGYLTSRSDGPSYFPTMKITRLGDWIPGALFETDMLLPILERLREQTQETITLTLAEGTQMRCIQALIGTHPIALQISEGIALPMFGTAIGTAWLATLDDDLIRSRWALWSRQAEPRARLPWAQIAAQIADARATGFAKAYDSVLPDTGAIAVAVPQPAHDETVIVAVAGLASRIAAREQAIIDSLQRSLKPMCNASAERPGRRGSASPAAPVMAMEGRHARQ